MPRFVQPEGFSLGCPWKSVAPCVPRRAGFLAQYRAVANRVAREVPAIGGGNVLKARALLRQLRQHVYLFCCRHLKPFSPSRRFGFEEWLDGTHYEAWRKDELRKVKSRFPNKIAWKDVLEHSKPKGFVKLESYPFFKFPRGIHAREDWVKAWIGPYIKAVESEVYVLPQFIKHTPVPARPEYVKQHVEGSGLIYAATDYSAYESSFRKAIQKVCEGALLQYMARDNPCLEEVRWFCRMCQGKNVLRYKDGTFSVLGRRMSGEMTTSLGNGWTNLMLATFVLRHRDVRCVVEGDDGLFALQPWETSLFTPEAFASFGFVIKLELHKDIETASFCGIVYAQDARLNLADPIAELVNFSWSLGPLRFRLARDLLRAKAMSLAYEYPGAPIMSALARYVLRVTGDGPIAWEKVASTMSLWHRDALYAVMDTTRRGERCNVLLSVPVSICSRNVVARKFGVSEDLQRRTEDYLDGLNVLQPLEMPWLLHLVHPDCVMMNDRYVFDFKAGTSYGTVKTVMSWKVVDRKV